MEDKQFADLHLHTRRSDGYFTARELLQKVKKVGLKAIAIVDHDEVGALPEAISYGKQLGIEVLPGVELSVDYKQYDLHLLGYGFDFRHLELLEYLEIFKNGRVARAAKIVDRLADLGMPISFEAVKQKAGEGTIGRPHIANVLVDDGFVYSFKEAFDKYIGNGKPANVRKARSNVIEVIKLIKSAGGLCSVAHPAIEINDDDLIFLIKLGVDGIEVVHPRHDKKKTNHYRLIVDEYGLLATGGSDFHGVNGSTETLGEYNVPYQVVTEIKKRTGFFDAR